MTARPVASWFDANPAVARSFVVAKRPVESHLGLKFTTLLGIGRRRAQQLLSAVAQSRVGTSLVANRADVVAHLQRIAAGEETYYDSRRRKQLWTQLSEARQEWIRRPPVLVEVPNAQVRQMEFHDFDGLPEGVELVPGSITVRFQDPDEALQKLMALACRMASGGYSTVTGPAQQPRNFRTRIRSNGNRIRSTASNRLPIPVSEVSRNARSTIA